MEKTTIPQQLKSLRKTAGYTQEQVARMLHMTRSAYANYESGKRTPTLDCIAKLASLYATSIDTICGYRSMEEIAAANAGTHASLSHDEMRLIQLYRELSSRDKKEILEYELFRKARANQKTTV